MDTKIKEKLTALQTEFLSAAAEIKECSRDLAAQVTALGLSQFKEDMLRIETAAVELLRRTESLLSARRETVSAIAADPSGVAGKLRHDLRNVVGALTGYLEMVAEDLQEAGIEEDLGIEAFLAKVAAMEKSIGAKVKFSKPKTSPAPDDRPLEKESGEAAPDTARPQANALSRDPGAIRGRILVVDDDQSSRELIATRLIRDGHTVDQAANGRAAFALMADKEFDVILLDLMMPEMNGFEVLSRMRENGQLRQSSVIVVSGLDQEENAIKSISLGAEDYLPKPVNPVLLRARIGSSLARKQWRDQERLYRLHLEAEKSKSEALLLNTLPALVVKRLSLGEKVIADAYDNVTVLFSDFANFTGFAADHDAKDLVEILNRIFTEFDDLGADLGAEKIKTIGDGYLVAAGLPTPRDDHAEVMADMALGMIDSLESMNRRFGTNLEIRIGLNSGPVIAGVIGSHKFAYDIWGQTVNSAARHESYSLPQHIHVSEQTASLLRDKFELVSRGRMHLRGIGEVTSYFLTGRKVILGVIDDTPEIRIAPANALSVLIADDDQNFQELMARRMDKHGWQTEIVGNGADAWSKLTEHEFDLVITDCEMPIMNGLELAQRIRRHEEETGERVAIIGITGNDSKEFAGRCLAAGMDAFLRKPVMWVELERTIQRLCAGAIEPAAIGKNC